MKLSNNQRFLIDVLLMLTGFVLIAWLLGLFTKYVVAFVALHFGSVWAGLVWFVMSFSSLTGIMMSSIVCSEWVFKRKAIREYNDSEQATMDRGMDALVTAYNTMKKNGEL
jgi:hypothetical protein